MTEEFAAQVARRVREIGEAGKAGPYIHLAYGLGLDYQREWWAAVLHDMLTEHDRQVEIAVIEKLADKTEKLPTSDPGTAWFNKDSADWLREQAQKLRREGIES